MKTRKHLENNTNTKKPEAKLYRWKEIEVKNKMMCNETKKGVPETTVKTTI